MKPTTEQIIDWGRTALNETDALIPPEWNTELLEAICSAAYAAGAAAEREECAKVCDAKVDAEYATGKVDHNEMGWTQACAIAIRARREQ